MNKTDEREKPLIVKKSQLVSLLGVSETTIWRWERDGKFPQRRRIGPGRVGWFYAEIKEFLENCEKVA